LIHVKENVMQELPSVLGSWTRRLSQEGEGLGLSLRLHGLERLEAHLDRSSNRVALALATLGLYIAGSLLMCTAPVLSCTAFRFSRRSPMRWRCGSPFV
jgi:hypothetical protein